MDKRRRILGFIFDNLIAEKKMRPTMHAAGVTMKGNRAENLKEFEPLLVGELAREIKNRYRAENRPDLWALAGLSLGGENSMTVGLRHPELFRTVASISGSMVERDFEDRFSFDAGIPPSTGGPSAAAVSVTGHCWKGRE